MCLNPSKKAHIKHFLCVFIFRWFFFFSVRLHFPFLSCFFFLFGFAASFLCACYSLSSICFRFCFSSIFCYNLPVGQCRAPVKFPHNIGLSMSSSSYIQLSVSLIHLLAIKIDRKMNIYCLWFS